MYLKCSNKIAVMVTMHVRTVNACKNSWASCVTQKQRRSCGNLIGV